MVQGLQNQILTLDNISGHTVIYLITKGTHTMSGRTIGILAVLCITIGNVSMAKVGGNAANLLGQSTTEDVDTTTNFRCKITFDISKLDEYGLYGPKDGKRALAYEFCIPENLHNRAEVMRIDSTVKFYGDSQGRIGCKEHENLCIGSTNQKNFKGVLQRLAELTYVRRIDESFFE